MLVYHHGKLQQKVIQIQSLSAMIQCKISSFAKFIPDIQSYSTTLTSHSIIT